MLKDEFIRGQFERKVLPGPQGTRGASKNVRGHSRIPNFFAQREYNDDLPNSNHSCQGRHNRTPGKEVEEKVSPGRPGGREEQEDPGDSKVSAPAFN